MAQLDSRLILFFGDSELSEISQLNEVLQLLLFHSTLLYLELNYITKREEMKPLFDKLELILYTSNDPVPHLSCIEKRDFLYL